MIHLTHFYLDYIMKLVSICAHCESIIVLYLLQNEPKSTKVKSNNLFTLMFVNPKSFELYSPWMPASPFR